MPIVHIPASEAFEFTAEDLMPRQKAFIDKIKAICQDYSIEIGAYGHVQILDIEYFTIIEKTKSGPIYSGKVEIKISI